MEEQRMSMRSLARLLATLIPFTLAPACGGDGADADLREPAPLAADPAPELDVDTSQADTPAGDVTAQHASDHTYVGAVTEELYIAVTLDEGIDVSEPQRVLVYVCDGQHAEYLAGEVDSGGATLHGQVLDVELALGDDAVSGTVIPHGDEPLPFSAEPATGEAGLYVAAFDHDGYDYRPVWVVLPDGSQRGGACWRCCSGRECHICCPAAADTAGPTVDWSELQYWWRRWIE
jgi:hypothetical protein